MILILSNLADHLQHCDGGSEEADVEARQLEIYVTEVTNTVCQHLTTRLTVIVLLTGTLKSLHRQLRVSHSTVLTHYHNMTGSY